MSFVDLTGGGVGVRADAQDIWITPRPAWEQLPTRVRSVSILMRSFDARAATPVVVRSASRIRRLVAVIDRLAIQQPGWRSCPISLGPSIVVRFLGAGAARPLAQLTATPCDGLAFRLGGTVGPPLDGADQLIDAVNQLGVIADCRSSQLRVDGGSVAPGYPAGLTLISLSPHACLLGGYPRLILRDQTGARLPVGTADERIAAVLRPTIDMTPGAAAASFATWREPQRACAHTAASLQIALPGPRTGSLTASLTHDPNVPWPCQGTITVQPFSPQP